MIFQYAQLNRFNCFLFNLVRNVILSFVLNSDSLDRVTYTRKYIKTVNRISLTMSRRLVDVYCQQIRWRVCAGVCVYKIELSCAWMVAIEMSDVDYILVTGLSPLPPTPDYFIDIWNHRISSVRAIMKPKNQPPNFWITKIENQTEYITITFRNISWRLQPYFYKFLQVQCNNAEKWDKMLARANILSTSIT